MPKKVKQLCFFGKVKLGLSARPNQMYLYINCTIISRLSCKSYTIIEYAETDWVRWKRSEGLSLALKLSQKKFDIAEKAKLLPFFRQVGHYAFQGIAMRYSEICFAHLRELNTLLYSGSKVCFFWEQSRSMYD